MVDKVFTVLGSAVMVMGIVCVVVGHGTSALKWVRRKIHTSRG